MNNRMIVYMIGRMLGVEGLLLLVPALCFFLYGEQSGIAFLLTAAILLIIFCWRAEKNRKIRVFMEKKACTGRDCLDFVVTVRCTAVFISGSIP